jgi:hypothetical protein
MIKSTFFIEPKLKLSTKFILIRKDTVALRIITIQLVHYLSMNHRLPTTLARGHGKFLAHTNNLIPYPEAQEGPSVGVCHHPSKSNRDKHAQHPLGSLL